jgi:protein-lysine methyltransferase-like protein
MWPLARLEAAAKQPWLTSLTHLLVPLGVAPIELVALLDGTNSRRALVGRGLKNGMTPPVGLAFGLNDRALEEVADQYVERVLTQFAFHALLEPADPRIR